jgi:hypothetical protein
MGISVILPISFLPILAFGIRLLWRLWKSERAMLRFGSDHQTLQSAHHAGV